MESFDGHRPRPCSSSTLFGSSICRDGTLSPMHWASSGGGGGLIMLSDDGGDL
jgi:hypothetical protein